MAGERDSDPLTVPRAPHVLQSWCFFEILAELNLESVLESLVLKKQAARMSQRLTWTSGAGKIQLK